MDLRYSILRQPTNNSLSETLSSSLKEQIIRFFKSCFTAFKACGLGDDYRQERSGLDNQRRARSNAVDLPDDEVSFLSGENVISTSSNDSIGSSNSYNSLTPQFTDHQSSDSINFCDNSEQTADDAYKKLANRSLSDYTKLTQ